MRKFFILLFGLVTTLSLSGQRPVLPHNIGTASLNITTVDFGNDYIITGTTAANTITVQSGYDGTITLNNVTMTQTGAVSCITILGLNNQSNLNPVTKVNIILDGDNDIQYKGGNFCAIQVNQGAQIHISAIDPNDNASGYLFASSSSYVKGTPFVLDPPSPYGWGYSTYAGAGIGAPIGNAQGSTTIQCDLSKAPFTGPCASSGINNTAGGNIIISSGTIFAHGGHGAGIGGGYQHYYDGIIVITGGDVQAYSQAHAAGIGSGCPCGQGVDNCYGPNSAIIVLPPAEIKAAGAANLSPYHFRYDTEYALAGMANIIYLNDPNKALITVYTQDTLPNANIYLDLTQMSDIVNIFNSLGLSWYDLTKVRVGRTDATTGMLDFRAELQQPTTFFTDASSINPATLGRPYLPVVRTITGNFATRDTVILPLLPTDISFTDFPSIPLEVGYSAGRADTNAFRTKVSYNDAVPMTSVTYVLQDGIDFSSLIFLAADSLTVIPPPATLTNGMVFYIIFPIDVGKPLGVYSDVLLIDGIYGSTPLPGYIRKIGMQRVVFDDSYTNDYIRVTADTGRFTTMNPTTNTVTLTLNIDHTGTSVLYDYLDVVAMYLVTPIADYNDALAANPLYSSGWQTMNVPLTNNGVANTTVDFSTMTAGTYYIHWYVESGVVYAHSLDVVSPPALYGGFGPYTLMNIKANDDFIQVIKNFPTLIPVKDNDILLSSCASIIPTVTVSPVNGTATLQNDSILYIPSYNYVGNDSLTYRIVCSGDTSYAKVRIRVIDAPDNVIDVDCYVDAPSTIWDIGLSAVSNVEVHPLATPFVGDLDGDGRVEVVVPNPIGYTATASAILILNDQLQLIRTITPPTPMPNYGTMSLAIADVDYDGIGDIIVATIAQQLMCYSHTGALKWTTTAAYTIQNNANDCISLIVADINGDGNCEILASNNIYAGESGILLASLPLGGRGYAEGGPPSFMPVFADIDNDGLLEVVAGNTVYKVTITNRSGTAGNSALIQSQINLPDGFTSVADINLDGRPDIIVTGGHASTANTAIMYVWDGMTGAQIGNTISVASTSKRISRAFAGDITGNGRPDIAFTYTSMMEAYAYNESANQFNRLWQKTTTDASGATTMSMFDFDQNGEVELVYRDQDSLRIINKLGDNIITFPCTSATHTEYPVIVDIDKDGHADILVSGGISGYTGTRIIRYSSVTPNQWASARSVWNQHAYNAVHINEDLSIPRYQINPAIVFPNGKRPYNAFLQQQTMLNPVGDPLWRAPDADTLHSTVQTTVNGNAVTVTVEFFNFGETPLGPPVHVAIYKENLSQIYTSADTIATGSIPIAITPGSSGQVTIVIPDVTTFFPFANMVIRLNDNGLKFPFQPECDTLNNIITIPNPLLNTMVQKKAVLFIPPSDSIVHDGFYANPVAAYYDDTIEYRISAINAYLTTKNVFIRDTLPAWLDYVSNSDVPLAIVFPAGNRTEILWSYPVLSMDTLTVRVRAMPQPGVSASQPLFDNRAWVAFTDVVTNITDTILATNYTFHQGVGVSVVTFSADYGGKIFQALEQVLDYHTSPRAGIVIVPDEGYRFAGWSQADYISLRGELISAQSGIMHYDTLIIYGNVNLQADFELEVYPITYYLNGGQFPERPNSQFSILNDPFPIAYTIESGDITLEAPEKEGDVFVGWTGSNGDEPQLTITVPHGSTGEKVFFANYLHSGREAIGLQPQITPSNDLIWAVKNELFVRTTKAGSILRIYSLDGVLLRQQTVLQPGETQYRLPNGIYVATLNNGIGKTVVIK